MMGWVYNDGKLHCDNMPLGCLKEELRQKFGDGASPAFVYSHSTLVANVRSYTQALATLGSRGVLSYSLKANSNPALLKILRETGVTMATCVSGNEVQMAIQVGFPTNKILLNGNGKRRWEVELAVRGGSLLNVDSLFDARLIVEVAQTVGMRARLLLRLNPALDAHTHPYLATAQADSKFGVEESQIKQVLEELCEAGDAVEVVGVHIHIGSAITRLDVYTKLMVAATRTLNQIRQSGWSAASIINLGGGLSTNFSLPSNSKMSPPVSVKHSPETVKSTSALHTAADPGREPSNLATSTPTSMKMMPKTVNTATPLPSPGELVGSVLPLLPDDVTLVLEPGRSLVATAGVMMTEVLGVKSNAGKQFVVVDAAMTEVIRPALYGACHTVTFLTPPHTQEDKVVVDVVGGVCESGDFLARDCVLPCLPAPGSALVLWTAGAYCASMSSNYNLRPYAIQVLVHGSASYKVIRRPQQFLDLFRDCV